MRFLALLLTTLALAATALTACGKDAAPAASSAAASLAPTDAVVYAEAALDPDEDQQRALEALLAKFPGGDGALAKLRGALEDVFDEPGARISYADDIEPWLGDTAAIFVGGFGASAEPRDIAGMLATEDEGKAIAAIEKSEPKARSANYEDVAYVTFDADGDTLAAGAFDGWLVIGTISGFKAAVDASQNDGLGGTDRYERALEGLQPDRLGMVYLDTRALVELARAVPGGGGQALQSLKGELDEPIVLTLSADADSAQIDTSAPAGSSAVGSVLGQGSKLLGQAPADAWLAYGQPDLGKVLERALTQFGAQLGGKDQIDRQLRAATGLGLDETLGWMGDFSLFVRGESVPELGGALVVETTDPASSSKTLKAIERLAGSASDGTRVRPLGISGDGFQLTSPDVPQPIYLYQRDERVVIAYGEQAAKDALDVPRRLTDSSDFKAATDKLGDGYDVSIWLAVKPLLELVDSTPAGVDEEWRQARPYLEPLGALVSGAKQDGDRVSSTLRITVP